MVGTSRIGSRTGGSADVVVASANYRGLMTTSMWRASGLSLNRNRLADCDNIDSSEDCSTAVEYLSS